MSMTAHDRQVRRRPAKIAMYLERYQELLALKPNPPGGTTDSFPGPPPPGPPGRARGLGSGVRDPFRVLEAPLTWVQLTSKVQWKHRLLTSSFGGVRGAAQP